MIFEKIRERLKEKSFVDYEEYYTDNGECLISISDTIGIINQVEAEYNNGWIRVDDRLPEPYKCVLVLEENGEIHLCRYHNESKRFYYDGSDWDIKLGCVTHWRELPQPPKGE
jgi:hypothetical protein